MATPAALPGRLADVAARPRASQIAGLDILHDLDAAKPIWRQFEDRHQLLTPYQRFDFLSAWQNEVGARDGLRPLIIIAHDRDRRPLLLLPLAIRKRHGVRTAGFMGGKHANFNMALCDRDFAAAATFADLHVVIAALRERGEADLLALLQQPTRWRDLPNPLALLPHQASANDCPLLVMPPGSAPDALISHSFRRRLQGKERKLRKLRGYRHHLATSDDEIQRLLDWFFATKPLRMAEQNLPDVFAEPGIEAFIRHACTNRLASGGRVIDIHALECDDEVMAVFAGVADGHRISMMFNTYTTSAHSRFSPGLILIGKIVDHYARRGFRELDLGVGTDQYKKFFCKSDEAVIDSFIPLSLRGVVAASALSSLHRAKHRVKHNRMLLEAAQRLRILLR